MILIISNSEFIDFDVEDIVARKLPLKDYANSENEGGGINPSAGVGEDSGATSPFD